MKRIVALMVLLSVPAFAEDVKPASPQVDPNTTITITVGELQALLQAEHDKIATEAVAAKIQAQIKAKK
jgi:hypothetical protein